MIIINGKVIQSHSGNGDNIGGNVVISNGKIIIDGKDVTPDSVDIKIEIKGNVDKLKVDACNFIKVIGDVNNISSHNGNVDIDGNVLNNCSTHNGNIKAHKIKGSAKTQNGNIYK